MSSVNRAAYPISCKQLIQQKHTFIFVLPAAVTSTDNVKKLLSQIVLYSSTSLWS